MLYKGAEPHLSTNKDPIKQEDRDNSKNNWENKTSGDKEPSSYANIEQPIKFGKLTYNISSSGEVVDVIVVGGGISGMTTAYLLSKSGKKVVVIEDGYIGSGLNAHYQNLIEWDVVAVSSLAYASNNLR